MLPVTPGPNAEARYPARTLDRLNTEGLAREKLMYALQHRADWVRVARRMDRCLLCCAGRVNEAGLCDLCYGQLNDAELRLAESWLAGRMP
jgi:hypothetical protein